MHTIPATGRPVGRTTAASVVLTLLGTLLLALVPGVASAAPATGSLTVGSTVSFESVNYPGRFVRHVGATGQLDPVDQNSSAATRGSASFVVRAGLAGSAGISLESVDAPGTYLNAPGGDDVGLDPSDGSSAFAATATFRAVSGLAGQGTSLQLWARPDTYVRHYSFYLYADPQDGTSLNAEDASFLVRQGLSTPTPAPSPSPSPSPSATPAATARLTPIADCYTSNSDGTTTVVLGYTNPGSTTVSIPAGARNTFNPTRYNSSLPTSFAPGTTHGAASVVIARADLGSQLSWTLDGTTLSTTTAVPTCTTSQLPMLASGGALLAGFVLAGAAGYVALRRTTRRATGAAAPSPGPGA